jgi:hypothetical protein
MVLLTLANPIIPDSLSRGFRRIRPDGSQTGEYQDPYGFVIPRGKSLVVTDLAYYSGFTNPQDPGDMTRLMLGMLTVNPTSIQQLPLFVTAPLFAKNGSYGGNVTLETGFAIRHGHFLTASFLDSELVSTYVFVYGYLAPST